jgi:hypothetical protein
MDAETISRKTSNAIETRGYCFWQCSVLNNDVIAIIKNGANNFSKNRATDRANELIKTGKLKEMPAIYTVDELRVLCESPSIQLIHIAKKEGATIVTEEGEEIK